MKVKPILIEKNYGLPLGKTITHTAQYPHYHYSEDGKDYDYAATYHLVDSDRMDRRKGDIVRLDSESYKKDVRKCFAVILDRYVVIKQKQNGTFRDYCTIMMLITGKCKGELYHTSQHNTSSLSKVLT